MIFELPLLLHQFHPPVDHHDIAIRPFQARVAASIMTLLCFLQNVRNSNISQSIRLRNQLPLQKTHTQTHNHPPPQPLEPKQPTATQTPPPWTMNTATWSPPVKYTHIHNPTISNHLDYSAITFPAIIPITSITIIPLLHHCQGEYSTQHSSITIRTGH